MKLIDTHIHLDFKNFQRDRSEVIARAQKAGLVALINSGASLGGNRKTIDLVDQYPGFIFATLGYHPTQVVTSEPKDVDQALIFVEQYKTKIVGIGETGLDYYHVKDSIGRHRQKEVFEKFISLANKFNLPLVIHSRDAEVTAFDIVKKAKVKQAVFHCFGGDAKLAKEIIASGYYISIATIVCFSERHQNLVKEIPLTKLLIETDSPYLSPFGKRNEPAFIKESVEKIARIKNLTAEEVASQTTQNAVGFYKLSI